jgi:hypothetical protein
MRRAVEISLSVLLLGATVSCAQNLAGSGTDEIRLHDASHGNSHDSGSGSATDTGMDGGGDAQATTDAGSPGLDIGSPSPDARLDAGFPVDVRPDAGSPGPDVVSPPLDVTAPDSGAVDGGASPCAFAGYETCTLVKSDPMTQTDPLQYWGSVDCASPSREQFLASGGPGNGGYRNLNVQDGDSLGYSGERCEIGHNESRYGTNGGAGTFWLYPEGSHYITTLWYRFPADFDLSTFAWQDIMQMKQAQPYVLEGNGGSVSFELEAYAGMLRLATLWTERWSTPAPASNQWFQVAFDVVYSQNPTIGSATVYVDPTGDGTWPVRSPTLHLETLQIAATAGDGYNVGDSLPGHLRVGIYHDTIFGPEHIDVGPVHVYQP